MLATIGRARRLWVSRYVAGQCCIRHTPLSAQAPCLEKRRCRHSILFAHGKPPVLMEKPRWARGRWAGALATTGVPGLAATCRNGIASLHGVAATGYGVDNFTTL